MAAVLLDSGNGYEAYWHSDLGWTPEAFRDAARILGPDLAFCFDEQNPPDDSSLAANVVVDRTTADQTAVGHTMVIPIVHANPDNMAGVVSKVVRALHPVMVAVPERELGNGIVERCTTMRGIRNALDDSGYYCPIHVLGTGHPFTLVALTLSGADSFDGLEWCQTSRFRIGGASWDTFSTGTYMLRLVLCGRRGDCLMPKKC